MTDQHSSYPSGHRGVVHNSVTGTVGGTLIQAGDLHGDLTFGDGPGAPPVVQVGRRNAAQSAAGVALASHLVGEIEAYLAQMSGADHGQRSARAEELLRQLRERS
ncbi:MAG TPA: hypothetical protein VGX23_33375 [Actinocrinis sp.]|nr:hypothetical protein [Actinocrinis sp.]